MSSRNAKAASTRRPDIHGCTQTRVDFRRRGSLHIHGRRLSHIEIHESVEIEHTEQEFTGGGDEVGVTHAFRDSYWPVLAFLCLLLPMFTIQSAGWNASI